MAFYTVRRLAFIDQTVQRTSQILLRTAVGMWASYSPRPHNKRSYGIVLCARLCVGTFQRDTKFVRLYLGSVSILMKSLLFGWKIADRRTASVEVCGKLYVGLVIGFSRDGSNSKTNIYNAKKTTKVFNYFKLMYGMFDYVVFSIIRMRKFNRISKI